MRPAAIQVLLIAEDPPRGAPFVDEVGMDIGKAIRWLLSAGSRDDLPFGPDEYTCWFASGGGDQRPRWEW